MAVRLALGTAQFGMNYGVTNRSGRIADEEMVRIIETARAQGIDTIDTAIAYGDAESRLGAVGVEDFRVITKLPPVPHEKSGRQTDELERSLDRLRIPRVHAVLLHRPEDLIGRARAPLRDTLDSLLARGLVTRVGVSVYRPEQLDALEANGALAALDVVQLPFNAFDQRMVQSGWVDRLASRGVEIHARSVLLQGLLPADPSQRPAWCSRWDEAFRAWDTWRIAIGADGISASLAAARHPSIARVVVGVENAAKLKQLALAAAREDLPVPPGNLCVEDIALLEPVHWPRSE